MPKGLDTQVRLSIIHSFYRSKFPSGENNAVLDQIRLLAKSGHEVTLISRKSDDIGFLKTLRSAINVSFYAGSDPSDELRDSNPELIHVHNLFPNFGYRWLENIHIPVVATFHNFRPFCSAGTFMRSGSECFSCPEESSISALTNKCYRDSTIASLPLSIATRGSGRHNPLLTNAKEVIVLSEYAKDKYEKFGPKTLEAHVLPNFAYPDVSPSAFRTKGNWWVFVGRLSEEKGIERLLEVWPRDEIIHVYGVGPLEPHLKERFGPQANIHFRGFLDPLKRSQILRQAIGLIFPSTCKENSPLIVGEAFSVGLPIVAYSENVVGEEISRNGAGQVFANFQDVEKALSNVRKNRDQASVEALNLYGSRFSPEVWLRKVTAIYESAMDQI